MNKWHTIKELNELVKRNEKLKKRISHLELQREVLIKEVRFLKTCISRTKGKKSICP